MRARKVTTDSAGIEAEMPMDEWVQVGVFAPAGQGADSGETLYLQMHRIRSGEQTISVTVPREPSDAGIDPYHPLIELERFSTTSRRWKSRAEGASRQPARASAPAACRYGKR